MKQYGTKEYWDERYSKSKPEELYDWYFEYNTVKDFFKIFGEHYNFLNIGCGTSRFTKDMIDEGYFKSPIINIDISEPSIVKMGSMFKDDGKLLKFIFMDAGKLEFKDKQFDVVMDKGMLDSILCGDLPDKIVENILQEVYRVLADEGTFICMSHALPAYRETYFKKFNWDIDFKTVKKSNLFSSPISEQSEESKKSLYYYVYFLKKKLVYEPTEEEKAEMKRKEEEAKKAEEARIAEEAKKLEEQKEAEKKNQKKDAKKKAPKKM